MNDGPLFTFLIVAATSAALGSVALMTSAKAQDDRILLTQHRDFRGGDFHGKGRFKGMDGFKGKGGLRGNSGFNRRGEYRRGSAPGAAAERTVPFDCHRICSEYDARTRCDGSRRSARYPVHHGIDIHIHQGTPLLAIADGVVVGATTGGSIGGIGLVIHHPPGTISPNQHVFAIYKHLRSRSPLDKGTHVQRGQRVGTSGNSGTADLYFGPNGFSHLHFETYISRNARWPGGKITNPVGILRGHGWPVACR